MSLPNYLARIKSSGIYRFVWDKSIVPPQDAETMRLVVGYSEKGPFNTPVYIDNVADFITMFGNISKKLERKGIFFHRLAIQALAAGPILALNLKKFKDETVKFSQFDSSNVKEVELLKEIKVSDLYDTNRFWYLNVDTLPAKATKNANSKYITISATDVHDLSSSIVVRKSTPAEYNLTFREFFSSNPDEVPTYLENMMDEKMNDYFLEVYTFKGQFTEGLCTGDGPLKDYFTLTEPITTEKFVESEAFKNATKEEILDMTLQQLIDLKTHTSLYANKGINVTDIKIAADKFNKIDSQEPASQSQQVDKKTKTVTALSSDPQQPARALKTEEIDKINKAATKETVVVDGKLQVKAKVQNAFGEDVDGLEALAEDSNSNFIAKYEGITLPYFKDGNGRYISLDIIFNAGSYDHKLLMKMDDALLDNANELITIQNYIKVGATELTPVYMEGYTFTGGNDSLEVLNEKGIREALTNRVDVEYHYLVDTFKSDINADKSIFSQLCKDKQNAFAILNFPPMQDFVNDANYKNGGKFDIKLIAEKYHNMPIELSGASYCGFFTNLVFGDGTMKEVIPSAALVSNRFIDKVDNRQPYYIVAGPNYGSLAYRGLIGPDYNYSRSDLDVLEPMGVNAIIFVPRKGIFINSNQTAKQKPVSALSKIHVRELVIFLQDEIESMLQNYQWELNTQTLRDTIKAKADYFLENVKNNGGVYEYYTVCDGTNNTPEVIDNEMIILDVGIEPARGAGKMVQQLTIYRTGGIASRTK